ncbi:hypothetical protein H072_6328 [Dactylellina haptotyla CBS 200.50]|uniref:Uncharacterized protein n=1 Tax=Dactylellina haptotyla (strain CBS 200.50) TaxID=1284197 RepID=S8AAL3_DACHA|nr:hypothetical protein H072_6328 [Dactylellina haptotyla CBS 200.50]
MKVSQVISTLALLVAAVSALPAASTSASNSVATKSTGMTKAANGTMPVISDDQVGAKDVEAKDDKPVVLALPPLPASGEALKAEFMKHMPASFPADKKKFFEGLKPSVWNDLLTIETEMDTSLKANNGKIDISLGNKLANAWEILFSKTVPDFTKLPTTEPKGGPIAA